MTIAPEDLCNQALVEIGYPDRIASLEEGTRAADAALEVYRQVRDELLRAGGFPLARRANIPLVLLKGPPPPGGDNPGQPWSQQYPAPGFLYQYGYPSDCLDLKAIIPAPGAMFDLDPKPAVF